MSAANLCTRRSAHRLQQAASNPPQQCIAPEAAGATDRGSLLAYAAFFTISPNLPMTTPPRADFGLTASLQGAAQTRLTRSAASILIKGEPGWGKELFAQSIHNFSARKKGPLWPLTARPCPNICWKASFLAMKKALLPAHARAASRACLDWLTVDAVS